MNYDPLTSRRTTESALLTVPVESPREESSPRVSSTLKIKHLEALPLPRGPILRQESHHHVNPNFNRNTPESGTLKNSLEMTGPHSANSENKPDLLKRSPTSILKSSHPGALTKKSTVTIDPSMDHVMDLSIEHVNDLPPSHHDKKESHGTIIGSMQKLKSLLFKEKTLPSIDLDFDFEFENGEVLPQSKIDQLELLNRNLNFWESEEEKIAKAKKSHKNPKSPNYSSRKRESAHLTPRSFARINFWRRVKSNIVNTIKASYVFKPDGRFKISWDLLGMLFILYEVLMIPLLISFDFTSQGIDGLELVIDIFFLVDILMTFNTGYYSKGHLIIDRKLIVVNYLRCWFWIDLVASFPYSRVITQGQDSNDMSNNDVIRQSTRIIRIIRFFRFVRVIRLIRIFKLKSIFGKLENFISLSPTLNTFTGFLRLSCIILFIAHWIACFWHLIGDSEFGSEAETWLVRLDLQDLSWQSKYLASIYWAVTTMITVGYGDIVPVTDSERIYTLFTMLIASAVFAYSMNSINTLLANIDAERQEFKETIVWVKRYMRKMKLDPETRGKITKYLEYTLIEAKYRKDDETRLLSLLSDSLKDEVVKKINEGVLDTCEPLKKLLKRTFSEIFIIEMIYFFTERVYSPGEQIFTEGEDDGLCLYMVSSGPAKTVLSSSKELLLQNYGKGDYFGELEFFTGMDRKWNAKAGDDFVSIFSLKRKDFLALIADFSRDKERFFMIKDKIMLYGDYSNLDFKCGYCRKPPHLPLECSVMHFVINRPTFLKEQTTENNRFRSSFTRHARRTQGENIQRLELSALRIRANLAKEIEALDNQEASFEFHHTSTMRTDDLTRGKTNDFVTTRELDTGIKSISEIFDSEESKKLDFRAGKMKKPNKKMKKEVILESGFDAVYSFKEYFPHNNIEHVLKQVNTTFVQNMKIKRMKILRRFVRFALAFQKPKVQIKIKINPPPQTPSYQDLQRGQSRDMARIPEDVEMDTSMNNERIAEEQVVFNKKQNWQNDEFTKTMNIKLMPSPEKEESIEETSILVGDLMNPASDPYIEDKLKSYPDLNENENEAKEEVSNMLDQMIAKYGSEYIQRILSLKG